MDVDQQQNQNEVVGGGQHGDPPPDPRYHNVPAPRGNENQLLRCQKLMSQCPKYNRTTPWRQFVFEFRSWIEAFNITEAGDEFIKNAIVWAMRGQAQDMINLHREGTRTYTENVTWRDYAGAIEMIFAPRAESQLAKQEFKSYKQGNTEDMSSYLATKRALYEVAYPNNTGNFDTLFDEVINGIVNREVKRELRMRNPQNAEAMEVAAVQIVANVRAAYENGYGLSESKDGLYHTTMLGVRRNQEEPMDVNAMRRKLKSMEDTIAAFRREGEKGKCFNCNKPGHLAKDCRAPKRPGGPGGGSTYQGQGRGRGRGGYRPNPSSGGEFKYECHYCHKKGHKIADCFKKKADESKKKDHSGGRKVQDMNDQEEEENASGYQRFLGPRGETEDN